MVVDLTGWMRLQIDMTVYWVWVEPQVSNVDAWRVCWPVHRDGRLGVVTCFVTTELVKSLRLESASVIAIVHGQAYKEAEKMRLRLTTGPDRQPPWPLSVYTATGMWSI